MAITQWAVSELTVENLVILEFACEVFHTKQKSLEGLERDLPAPAIARCC